MIDIVELMRVGRVCDDKCRVMEARSGCLCAEAADEIERLRAALDILQAAMTAKKPIPLAFKKAIIDARAALEEGTTSPDERGDCPGFGDGLTVNPRGREDCEDEGRT